MTIPYGSGTSVAGDRSASRSRDTPTESGVSYSAPTAGRWRLRAMMKRCGFGTSRASGNWASPCGSPRQSRSARIARDSLWPSSGPRSCNNAISFSVAFHPNGRMLATATNDGTVRLWDIASRRLLDDPLRGHKGAVSSVAFSLDGGTLASAGFDGTVRLWNVVSRRLSGDSLKGQTGIPLSVAFSADGKLLASASSDGTVRLWDVARRKPRGDALNGHSDKVWSVAFSPDGKLLATASGDHTVRLWD